VAARQRAHRPGDGGPALDDTPIPTCHPDPTPASGRWCRFSAILALWISLSWGGVGFSSVCRPVLLSDLALSCRSFEEFGVVAYGPSAPPPRRRRRKRRAEARVGSARVGGPGAARPRRSREAELPDDGTHHRGIGLVG
jgi:hypothetical protein